MPKLFFKYLICTVLIMALGLSYGYFRAFFELKERPTDLPEEQHNQNVITYEDVKLEPGAKIIFVSLYKKCGHELIKEEIIDESFIGFTKEQLSTKYYEWNVDSFTPREVILKRDIDDICEDHYFVGIKDGYVALFRGIPGVSENVIEITDILADTLREEDLETLKSGLVIQNREKFLEIREGLSS